MKTFIFDTFNRYKRYSDTLDIQTILCNKTWWVFNDTGEKEVYIFQDDGSIIISVDGIVTNANWKYISANKSVVISTQKQNVMLQPFFVDEKIFSLQLDGTNNYVFLIDEKNRDTFQPKSLSDINSYFEKKEIEFKNIELQKKQAEILKLENEQSEIEREQLEINRNAKIQDQIAKVLAKDLYFNQLIGKYDKFETFKKKYNKIISVLVVSLIIIVIVGISYIVFHYTFPLPQKIGEIVGIYAAVVTGLVFLLLVIIAVVDSKMSRIQNECWRYEKDVRQKVREMY